MERVVRISQKDFKIFSKLLKYIGKLTITLYLVYINNITCNVNFLLAHEMNYKIIGKDLIKVKIMTKKISISTTFILAVGKFI